MSTLSLLHTSDWHLGVSADHAPRDQEHDRFLDWLLATLAERRTDVLVIAGDVYHYTQPSARCLKRFYSFLARCAGIDSLRQIVVVGGNHDSPSRLDAPRELLDSMDIHVVGGLAADETTWDRCFCPIRDAQGRTEAVIVGVPYIHEARLGVLTTNRDLRDIRAAMQERFAYLYDSLAQRARQLWPEAPLVATGHMTCFAHKSLGVDPEHQVPIHFAALIGALHPSIFGLHYAYVALGHIHEINEIPGSVAWYSGSPVPTCVVEARNPRYVLEARLNPDKPKRPAVVETIEVPSWRDNIELSASLDEVIEAVREVRWEGELAPYLYIEVLTEEPLHDGLGQVAKVLAEGDALDRPRVVRYREKLIHAGDDDDLLDLAHARLDQLTPEEVFTKMYAWKHEQDPSEELLDAFRTLLSETEPTT